jgi:hypothetical protein
MKKISKFFLFGSLFLAFLTAACGANQNATPTLSGTSLVQTSTPFMGLGTPVAGTATSLTPGTATTAIGTTNSETSTGSGAQVSTQVPSVIGSTATSAAIPVTGSEITLVDCQFCIDNLAHALLVLPDVSTFQVISPTPSTNTTTTTAVSCSTIEVNNGKQVVLCSGPASTPVMLTICTGGSCTNFPVNLQACPVAQSQQATSAPGDTQAAPTSSSGGVASPTATTAAGTPTPTTTTDTPTP